MLHAKKIPVFLSLSLLSVAVYAESAAKHTIVAPVCLVKKLSSQTDVEILASSPSLALIQTNDAGVEQFIEAKHKPSRTPCGGFIDVTDDWHLQSRALISAKSFLKKYEDRPQTSLVPNPYTIQYPAQVNALLKQFNSQLMWQDLAAFSNTSGDQFPDRYANSKTGIKAANWLKNKIETIAKENNRSDISAWFVSTGRYEQPSLVVKIGFSNEAGIVIGGHMDTLSSSWSVKPGADDDGSGSMTVMGVARTLLSSGMQFKKPVYFIWYAAEEEGLIGSGFVVKDFIKKKIPVDAVLQFDMTGYANHNDRTLWLVTDHVDSNLTTFLETLINTYIKQPVGRTRCGYGCSDHASWDQAGFKASFPFEASFNKDNPDIHTSRDTMDHLSLDHMTDYAKLGIAFAVERAEPVA